jgi:fibronectin type 3 domain-containing protein
VTAEAGKKKSITVTWTGAAGADSYNLYYSLSGKYSLITNTTSTSYKDSRLTSSQEYCYVVTSITVCQDQTVEESDYSSEVCATAP